jgi:moderate conductance mechanosensitive channel
MTNFSISEYLQHSREMMHVIIILILAWILLILSRKFVRAFHNYLKTRTSSKEDAQRIETLARVFRYTFTVVITLVATMFVLNELGFSMAPILGAAGVVGIAVGFGAQSLIKDYFNGFFLLVENQIRQGDVIEVCDKGGVVEDMTLRYVCLRDYEGNVHYIPNGLITTVTNKSRGYAFAVIDVSIAYSESIEQAFEIMREVSANLRESEKFGAKILEDIDIAGVQDWGDSEVILRCRFKTVALEQWGVRREFLHRIKEQFDARGIEIPYNHLDVTLYTGQDKAGNAPELQLVTRRP